jgi:acyl-CoA synthetase (AMP-forming)/AMP-acid ligase II
MNAAPEIIKRIHSKALTCPNQVAFVFIKRHNDLGKTVTWEQLWSKALSIATKLPLAKGKDKFAVLILCADEEYFVLSLLAVWIRGGFVIPGIGGYNNHTAKRNSHIFSIAQPDIILHDFSTGQENKLHTDIAGFINLDVTNMELAEANSNVTLTGGGGLMQFTSGSTSTPKAVLISQANITANCIAMTEAYSLDSHSVGVHWLPLYHDMGLVGSIVMPMWVGCTSIIMRPSTFIQNPLFWFEQIAKWRGTITSAPNFAYQKIAHVAKMHNMEGLDLSSLENIIIGGEPVHQHTIELLSNLFKPYGLNINTLAPSYGLAEATLLVSSGKRMGGPIFYNRDNEQPTISLGSPIAGVSVCIVDSKTGRECLEKEIGHIHISGDCVGSVIPSGENWHIYKSTQPIATGDYGFMFDGEIYITGRATNRIIVRGKNIFAEDVEQIVSQISPLINSDNIAAFGLDVDGSEELCILIEYPNDKDHIQIGQINSVVIAALSIKPAHIVILRRFTLPRTSSGKIMRCVARREYLAGTYLQKITYYVKQTGY